MCQKVKEGKFLLLLLLFWQGRGERRNLFSLCQSIPAGAIILIQTLASEKILYNGDGSSVVTLHYFLRGSLLNDNLKWEPFNSPAATKYNFSFQPLLCSALTHSVKLSFSGVTKRRIIFKEDEVNRHLGVPQDISCQVKDSFPFF